MSKIRYHPCSKEFQEEAKRLGLTGGQLIQKYIREGKIVNPIDIDKKVHENIYKDAGCKNITEYRNKCAQNLGYKNAQEYNEACYKNLGYKDKKEYIREWRYDNCIQLPMDENKDCSHYLGTFIAERKYGRKILPEMFGGIEKEMPYGNPKFDFIVNGCIKIDIKSCCLRITNGWIGWEPHVRFNNITDYFVILAFEDRENLNLSHLWCIGKNEIIRGIPYYRRESIKVTNKTTQLLAFKRFDWIDKLKCLKNVNNSWS